MKVTREQLEAAIGIARNPQAFDGAAGRLRVRETGEKIAAALGLEIEPELPRRVSSAADHLPGVIYREDGAALAACQTYSFGQASPEERRAFLSEAARRYNAVTEALEYADTILAAHPSPATLPTSSVRYEAVLAILREGG